ncbi:hypothetical protein [Actinophytocola sp.]|uniref:hypothetical protein n=1 Tax=Actinophytocola sp. TaxID=1872138 RepID=UPI00389AE509
MHKRDQPEREQAAAGHGRPAAAGVPARAEHPSPAHPSSDMVLALQRSVGNRTVAGLLADRRDRESSPGHPVQRSAPTLQRAPATLSAAQRSLQDLARRWKVQSFFALTTGRSNELQRVDDAVANWRQAVDTDPSTPRQDLLVTIQEAIADWRAAKGTGSRSYRAVHINALDTRVAGVLTHTGAPVTTPETEEDSEEEFSDEERSDWDAHSSGDESESGGQRCVLSRNGGMAIGGNRQTQDFFALPTIIDNANAALTARDSPLRLELSADRVPAELAGRGLRRVEPVLVVLGEEKRGDDLLTVNECIAVANKVTGDRIGHVLLGPDQPGSQRVSQKQGNVNDAKNFTPYPRLVTRPGMTPEQLGRSLVKEDGYVHFSWRSTTIDVDLDDEPYEGELAKARKGIVAQLAGAGMTAEMARVLLDAIAANNLEFHPGLAQIMVDRLETAGLLDGEPTEEHRREIADAAKKVTQLDRSRYRPYEAPDAARDSRLGINTAAAPRVGEAFAIYGTRFATREEQAAGRQANSQPPWSYHYAGVVARDGDDAVTLENYNRRGKGHGKDPNARWYFALYGPGRTFHETHQETVSGALTLVMG